MLKTFRDWFWSDNFWLPYGFTWDDVKECPTSSLYITPFIAVLILFLRYLFEKYVAVNFCLYIGIPAGAPTINDEETKRKVSDAEVSDTSETSVKQPGSFRKSRQHQQIQQFQKATETCWRCFAYCLLFVFGSYVILCSDWFWNTESWLIGYIVDQPFPDELKWYYTAELSFYIALVATHFTDTKRKDFMQQFVHHIVTIILIAGSFLIAHFRYGSVIMLLHDASDYWLEAAKLAKYAKKAPHV